MFIRTDTDRFRLRQMGGNPFADRILEALVGKTIEGEGASTGQTFILEKWRVIDD